MSLTEPITTCYCTGCKERQDTIDRLKAELAAAREDRKCENTDCSNIIDGNQNPGVCLACWNRVAVENSKLRALCCIKCDDHISDDCKSCAAGREAEK